LNQTRNHKLPAILQISERQLRVETGCLEKSYIESVCTSGCGQQRSFVNGDRYKQELINNFSY